MKTAKNIINTTLNAGGEMQIGRPLKDPVFIVWNENFAPAQFGTINIPSIDPVDGAIDRQFDRFNDVFEALSDA